MASTGPVWGQYGDSGDKKMPKKSPTLWKGFVYNLLILLIILVPIIGFELMTYRLQGGCSTN